jgi:hypothetical protein
VNLCPRCRSGPMLFTESRSVKFLSFFSVTDPWDFGTDPDPRNRTSDLRIRILLFTSVTFNTPTNFFNTTFWRYIYIIFHTQLVIKKSQNSTNQGFSYIAGW